MTDEEKKVRVPRTSLRVLSTSSSVQARSALSLSRWEEEEVKSQNDRSPTFPAADPGMLHLDSGTVTAGSLSQNDVSLSVNDWLSLLRRACVWSRCRCGAGRAQGAYFGTGIVIGAHFETGLLIHLIPRRQIASKDGQIRHNCDREHQHCAFTRSQYFRLLPTARWMQIIRKTASGASASSARPAISPESQFRHVALHVSHSSHSGAYTGHITRPRPFSKHSAAGPARCPSLAMAFLPSSAAALLPAVGPVLASLSALRAIFLVTASTARTIWTPWLHFTQAGTGRSLFLFRFLTSGTPIPSRLLLSSPACSAHRP